MISLFVMPLFSRAFANSCVWAEVQLAHEFQLRITELRGDAQLLPRKTCVVPFPGRPF
jgi:hypothetical protein